MRWLRELLLQWSTQHWNMQQWYSQCLSGAAVSTSDLWIGWPEFDPGRGQSAHRSPSCSSSQMGWWINGYLRKPGEGKLWKLGCHTGTVSRGNGLITTTGSKANVTGDEHLHLRTATGIRMIERIQGLATKRIPCLRDLQCEERYSQLWGTAGYN